MLCVILHARHEHAAVFPVDKGHEDQGHQNSTSGSQRAAHRAVDGLGRRALPRHCAHQKKRRADTHHCVGDLLQDLGDRRLQHGLIGLEVAAKHAQNAEQEYRRGKDLQHGNAVGRHQRACAKKQQKASQNTHGQCIDHGTMEYFLRVPVVTHSHLLRHLLGYGRRDAEARDHQDDRIDVDRCSVISVSLVAYDRCQR